MIANAARKQPHAIRRCRVGSEAGSCVRIRVLLLELTRIPSRLLNVTTQAMDVGALTPPLWGFEEREKLVILYERVSGARLHANDFRVRGVHQDVPPEARSRRFLMLVGPITSVRLSPTSCARMRSRTTAQVARRNRAREVVFRRGKY